MFTISQVAKQFGISRSTLLYYDRIGLLSPSARNSANYRLYSDADLQRMEKIDTFRRIGVPLRDIARILTGHTNGLGELLEKRLRNLNQEINLLRKQQMLIVHLLKCPNRLKETRYLDKKSWVNILRASGMKKEDMERWHTEFERLAPQAHQDFLEFLGINVEEIQMIREYSRRSNGS